MSLNYVTLTIDLYDAQGKQITRGTAVFTPTSTLKDTTNNQIIPTTPVSIDLSTTRSVTLLATDNGTLSPSGWAWNVELITFGYQDSFVVFLPFSGGATQHLADLAPLSTAPSLTTASPALVPSGDTSGTADTLAIQTALNAAPAGGAVLLAPGTFYLNTTLTVPTQVGLVTSGADSLNSPPGGVVLQPTASFSGSSVVALNNYSVLSGISINGSNLPAGNVTGIEGAGANRCILNYCCVYKVTGVGIDATSVSIGWHVSHCRVDGAGSNGVQIANHTDGLWLDVYVIGCTGHAWSISGSPANSRFVACRAEWSGAGKDGYHLTSAWGSGTGSGGCTFVGCSTDRNDGNGFFCNATGTVPVLLTGCQFRRDGRNGGSGAGGFAGISINGSTLPITVTGYSVFPGVDDGGAGTNSPQYGLSLINAPQNVVIGEGYLQGNTASRNWDNTGSDITFTEALIGASGPTSAPVLDTTAYRTSISAPVVVSNTAAETTLVQLSLPPGVLQPDSTYRINVMGTIATVATSGSLTFKAYMGSTAAAQQPNMPSNAGFSTSAFWLEMYVSVDSTGVSGTYVAHGRGEIEFSSRVNLATSSTTTTAVNTTGSVPIKLTATWATASASNVLTASIASIEKVA